MRLSATNGGRIVLGWPITALSATLSNSMVRSLPYTLKGEWFSLPIPIYLRRRIAIPDRFCFQASGSKASKSSWPPMSPSLAAERPEQPSPGFWRAPGLVR